MKFLFGTLLLLVLLCGECIVALPIYTYNNPYEIKYYEGSILLRLSYNNNLEGFETIRVDNSQSYKVNKEYQRLYFPITSDNQGYTLVWCNANDQYNNIRLLCESDLITTPIATKYQLYHIDMPQSDINVPMSIRIDGVGIQLNKEGAEYVFSPLETIDPIKNDMTKNGFNLTVAKRYRFILTWGSCLPSSFGTCIQNITFNNNIGELIEGEEGDNKITWTFDGEDTLNKPPQLSIHLITKNIPYQENTSPKCTPSNGDYLFAIGGLTTGIVTLIFIFIQLINHVASDKKIKLTLQQIILYSALYLFLILPPSTPIIAFYYHGCKIGEIPQLYLIILFVDIILCGIIIFRPPRWLKKRISLQETLRDIDAEISRINRILKFINATSGLMERKLEETGISERDVKIEYEKDRWHTTVSAKEFQDWGAKKIQQLETEKMEIYKKLDRNRVKPVVIKES